MVSAANSNSDIRPEHLAREVNYLAGEVRLLAINMAITLARMQGRKKIFGDMEDRFTELIKRANDTSQQVTDVLKAFQNHQRMIFGLPASSEIIEKRGAYDCLEAKLNHVYRLSVEMAKTISEIKRQEQVG